MNVHFYSLYLLIYNKHLFWIEVFKSVSLPLELVTEEIFCPLTDKASVELSKEDRHISSSSC